MIGSLEGVIHRNAIAHAHLRVVPYLKFFHVSINVYCLILSIHKPHLCGCVLLINETKVSLVISIDHNLLIWFYFIFFPSITRPFLKFNLDVIFYWYEKRSKNLSERWIKPFLILIVYKHTNSIGQCVFLIYKIKIIAI